MAYDVNINVGAPPLLWSGVNEALSKINQNFEILAATIGDGSGLTPIDFENLNSGVIPVETGIYNLGSSTHKWKEIYAEAWTSAAGNENNGVWLGTAQIKGISGVVELPENSTVGGFLINDPTRTRFKTFTAPGQPDIVAQNLIDTFNFAEGAGIDYITNPATRTLTIVNDGVVSAQGMSGISVSGKNPLQITNTGVLSVTNITTLPLGLTAGTGIAVNTATGNILITNTGVVAVSAGFGITVSTNTATGVATITNSAPAQVTFRTINVTGTAGQIGLVADSTADILTLNAGYGVIITTNDSTDTISFAVDQNIDITGSVFADDSTMLVDGTNAVLRGLHIGTLQGNVSGNVTGNLTGNSLGLHTGDVIGSVFAQDSTRIIDGTDGSITTPRLRTSETAIALGSSAGAVGQGANGIAIGALAAQTNQGIQSIAIGPSSGNTGQGLQSVAVGNLAGALNQGQRAVAIGSLAGANGQGDYAVALGNFAGGTNQPANSIVINASGVALNGSAAGFYVDPIRQQVSSNVVTYNPSTKELTHASDDIVVGSIGISNNKIISTVSSADIELDPNGNGRVITQSPLVVSTGYLTVPSYVDTTARDAAITSPSAGMIVLITGTAQFTGYSGAAWIVLN